MALRFAAIQDKPGSPALALAAAVPDLKNGSAANLQPIFLTSGIPDAYRWILDEVFADMDQDVEEGPLMRRICVEAAIHALCLREAPIAMSEDASRLRALVLAASRWAIRRAWGFVVAEIAPNQVFPVARASFCVATGELRANISGVLTVAAVDAEATLIEALYTVRRSGDLAKVMKIAIAAPITAGVTMVFTGAHHFVDPHKNVARCVSRQVLGGTTTTIEGLTADEFEDVMYHKAAHPIATDRLVGLARDVEIRDKLITVGLPAAAVRLPASYAPERAASAIVKLVGLASQAGTAYNVAVGTAEVDQAYEQVMKAIGAAGTSRDVASAARILETFIEANGHEIAWAAGFVFAMTRSSGSGDASTTVLESKAVTRIVAANAAGHAAGVSHYENAERWARTRARDGFLDGIGLFGAAAPAPIAPAKSGN